MSRLPAGSLKHSSLAGPAQELLQRRDHAAAADRPRAKPAAGPRFRTADPEQYYFPCSFHLALNVYPSKDKAAAFRDSHAAVQTH